MKLIINKYIIRYEAFKIKNGGYQYNISQYFIVWSNINQWESIAIAVTNKNKNERKIKNRDTNII